eukprot:CAMPEP_0173446286 /NCGR_PEP_ID=MMETSP1357-20121228/36288_1 /TAXON_ID=77926 /ORGANISM="Hemiselmis rufescens, Strain PCC563" /LENGTH=31 /DNA_ID= /DNA_START= /DNA_END= /DNA_ORIENTATION=
MEVAGVVGDCARAQKDVEGMVRCLLAECGAG